MPGVPARRRAVTLVELLLVLTLLVAIAGLTWPVVERSFANRRLQIAADQLRSDLVSTRVKAINNGAAFVVRHSPYSDRYTIEPYAQTAVLDAGQSTDVAGESADFDPRDFSPSERVLPDGITFSGAELLLDSRQAESLAGGQPGESFNYDLDDAAAGESQLLFCYPDGTTTTATIALENAEGRSIALELRGLTGVVTVSEIHSPAAGSRLEPAP